MKKIGEATNAHLKIQAFAGTGKTRLVALLVEAALMQSRSRVDSIVIVTPSRNLRDSVLQNSDFLGQVYDSDEYGSRVVWLGRPSDLPQSMCTWGKKMEDKVDLRLDKELEELKACEVSKVWVAYHGIASAEIHRNCLATGK